MASIGAAEAVGEGPQGLEGPESPELVIGLVSPIGAPTQQIIDGLKSSLGAYGYTASVIKVSKLLQDHAEREGEAVNTIGGLPEHDRVKALMNMGDKLCADYGNPAATLALGVNEMRTIRIEKQGDGCSSPLPRQAWILDSLKRPAEVTALREVYGDHAIIIAIDASKASRVEALFNKMKPSLSLTDDPGIRIEAEKLLSRDQSDASGQFGQDVVKTFPLADVFVRDSEDVDASVQLIFGDPERPGPTTEEHGMQLASVAATRSPELGLKVGAALMIGDDVVSLGSNAHPTSPGESPAFDVSRVEIEKLVWDTLSHLAAADIISEQARESLESNSNEWVKDLLAGPLRRASIRGLTEFQQTVHAEMAALLSALQQGRSIVGAHMYVTAYPCHGCAKHLLRLKVDVTYLEPYPKSLTEAMYGVDATQFAPFKGVAPRRFMKWFVSTEDRKLPDGTRLTWSEADRAEAIPSVDMYVSHEGILERESWFVGTMTKEVRVAEPGGAA